MAGNEGAVLNSIADEINRLAGEIEEALKIRLPGLRSDKEMTQWIQSNGLNGQVFFTKISKLVAFTLILKFIIIEYLNQASDSGHLKFSELADMSIISEQVNKQVGLELFPPSPLDKVIKILPPHVKPQADKIRGFAESVREDRENISAIYNSIVTQKERRKMGQFWTPDYIANFMVHWVLRAPEDKLFELGSGPAPFLVGAVCRLEKFGQKKDEMHKNLFGVELGFVPYLMGVANLLSRIPHAKRNIIHGDFLLMEPPNKSGSETSFDDFLPSKRTLAFDAIAFNPPYTRHHLLPSTYKANLLPAFEKRFGVNVSRLSSLFVYFIFHALSFLKMGGRMAFITPTIVFESRTSNSLKDFLSKNMCINAIVSFSDEMNVFPGVDTAACITLLEKNQPKNGEVVLMKIAKWPGKEEVLKALETGLEGEYEWGIVRKISNVELVSKKNWTTLVQSDHLVESSKFVKLGELVHDIRGIATGANDFFTLSDEEIKREGLEKSFLRPVIRRTRYAKGYVFNSIDFERLGKEGKKRWLLYCTERERDLVRGSNVGKYIRKGEQTGLNERSLIKMRRIWYEMEQRQVPPILFTYLGRRRSRFILNKAGVLALNVFLLIYPSPEINSNEINLKALLAVLNSGITRHSLREVGRSYGGDTLKLEPRQLEEARVLDPRKLTSEQIEKLAGLYDELCEKSGEQEEHTKNKIDQLIKEFVA